MDVGRAVEHARFTPEALERILWPRVYPFGECILTLPELVAARRAAYTVVFNEAFTLVQTMLQDLDLNEGL